MSLGKNEFSPVRRKLLKGVAALGVTALASSQDVFSSSTPQESNDSKAFAEQLLKKQYEQLEELRKKEEEIRALFGDFYKMYRADKYKLKLEELKETIIKQVERGENILFKDIVNKPLGPTAKKENQDIYVEALNTKDGILSKEALKKILRETYPNRWVEVSSIKQNNELAKQIYEGESNAILAICTTDLVDFTSVIIFYKPAQNSEGEEIVSALGHELAHANSWDADNEMTAMDRANLILQVHELMESSEHLKSSVVEHINEKNPKKNSYDKVYEYWAVICEEYFAHPEQLKKWYVKEYELVDIFVKKTDPTFDVIKAKVIRDKLTPGFVDPAIKKKTRPRIVKGKGISRIFHQTMEDGSRVIFEKTILEDDPLYALALEELERDGYEVVEKDTNV